MKQPELTTHLTDEPNRVEVRVAGWALDILIQDGRLMVFVYNETTQDHGCVAMAYDGNLRHDLHRVLRLVGHEQP